MFGIDFGSGGQNPKTGVAKKSSIGDRKEEGRISASCCKGALFKLNNFQDRL
jgi:hypothetical protein